MQEQDSKDQNLAWIRCGIQCLRAMLLDNSGSNDNSVQMPYTITAIERMVRSVCPEFAVGDTEPSLRPQAQTDSLPPPMTIRQTEIPDTSSVPLPSASAVDGFVSGGLSSDMATTEESDFTAADLGLDFDLGTMDMDAFLSFDPNQQDWVFGL